MSLLSQSAGCKFHLPPLRSSPTSSNNLTRLFLQLPPTYRSFHASPKPQFVTATIASAIYTSHAALVGVHTLTGLPWAYTIPVFAFALRATIILPISIYIRQNNQKQFNLQPLLNSWRQVLQRETMREIGHLGDPKVATKKVMAKTRAKRKELYRRWGCPVWKTYLSFLHFPVFLSVMEALREMCGAREGWLGMINGWVENSDITLTGEGVVHRLTLMADPTLATEGALWFPNLLIPDPQFVLPFMLSGAILLNIFGVRGVGKGKWSVRFRRGMGCAALMVGPMMLHMPSALVVYWISSSVSGWLQAILLDKFMPIKKQIQPCKPKRPSKSRMEIEEGPAKHENGWNDMNR